MPSFKAVYKSTETASHVLSYEPKILEKKLPEPAKSFIRNAHGAVAVGKSMGTGDDAQTQVAFHISDLVSHHTGLDEIEKKNIAAHIESEVLQRLKEIEQKAYAEAKELGLEEGRKQAIAETKAVVEAAIASLNQMLQSISDFKQKLLVQNEAHIVKLAFEVGKALAFKEMTVDEETVKRVITQALANAQSEENILLRISPSDAQHIEKIKTESGNPFERIPRLKIETSDSVTPGGCVVETNYGLIDASIEQRVKKVWDSLVMKIPDLKEAV